MVTQFNAKDLTSFGNYITSLIERGMKLPDPSGSYSVTHADIENWKLSVTKNLKVRAKFELTFIEQGQNEDPDTLHMSACVEGSPENKEFSKYTPGGNLTMLIDKDCEARKLFNEGGSFYLDFSKA